MAWTVSMTLDADKADVGSIVATWNAGEPDEFVYSRRARADGSDLSDFVREALNARATRLTVDSRSEDCAMKVQSALNLAQEKELKA